MGLPLNKTETIWHQMLSTVISYKPLKNRNLCAHTDAGGREGERQEGRKEGDRWKERESRALACKKLPNAKKHPGKARCSSEITILQPSR